MEYVEVKVTIGVNVNVCALVALCNLCTVVTILIVFGQSWEKAQMVL